MFSCCFFGCCSLLLFFSIQITEYELESHLDSLIVLVCVSLYSFPRGCNRDRDRIISCVTLRLAIVGWLLGSGPTRLHSLIYAMSTWFMQVYFMSVQWQNHPIGHLLSPASTCSVHVWYQFWISVFYHVESVGHALLPFQAFYSSFL